jgi:hypothetical protein
MVCMQSFQFATLAGPGAVVASDADFDAALSWFFSPHRPDISQPTSLSLRSHCPVSGAWSPCSLHCMHGRVTTFKRTSVDVVLVLVRVHRCASSAHMFVFLLLFFSGILGSTRLPPERLPLARLPALRNQSSSHLHWLGILNRVTQV